MAYGERGSCYTCKYLKDVDTWNGEVYCEYLKSYIKPDDNGCSNHVDKE